MRKKILKFWMLALTMMLGMASCSEKDNNSGDTTPVEESSTISVFQDWRRNKLMKRIGVEYGCASRVIDPYCTANTEGTDGRSSSPQPLTSRRHGCPSSRPTT